MSDAGPVTPMSWDRGAMPVTGEGAVLQFDLSATNNFVLNNIGNAAEPALIEQDENATPLVAGNTSVNTLIDLIPPEGLAIRGANALIQDAVAAFNASPLKVSTLTLGVQPPVNWPQFAQQFVANLFLTIPSPVSLAAVLTQLKTVNPLEQSSLPMLMLSFSLKTLYEKFSQPIGPLLSSLGPEGATRTSFRQEVAKSDNPTSLLFSSPLLIPPVPEGHHGHGGHRVPALRLQMAASLPLDDEALQEEEGLPFFSPPKTEEHDRVPLARYALSPSLLNSTILLAVAYQAAQIDWRYLAGLAMQAPWVIQPPVKKRQKNKLKDQKDEEGKEQKEGKKKKKKKKSLSIEASKAALIQLRHHLTQQVHKLLGGKKALSEEHLPEDPDDEHEAEPESTPLEETLSLMTEITPEMNIEQFIALCHSMDQQLIDLAEQSKSMTPLMPIDTV